MAEKESVLTLTYDLLKYIIPVLAKYPRAQKFLLADRIQLNVMDVLDLLIEAYYSKSADFKKSNLLKVNLLLEKLAIASDNTQKFQLNQEIAQVEKDIAATKEKLEGLE